MNITIQKAKNGEDTAVADGHFLHSNYAPVKEAQRFVENLTLPYNPSSIIITEPALAYTADFLRQKFPGIKIGAIRYSKAFENYNSHFDFILNYFEHLDFESYLESHFTEDQLLTISFISWPASSQIFINEDKETWKAIKAAMLRSKTLLITRQYFEKKWFLNSCHFLKNLNNIIILENKIEKDTLIISSGPSLIPFIELIKNNQKSFFIICLSSAITVCLKNNIIPDLVMTSDGGYWAGQHLKELYKKDIPLAMPSEAYCPKALLSKLKILPLDYGDGISSSLITEAKLNSLKAVRNGTVSGTALLFAAAYCTKNIYLVGLDLACRKGFQHSQPNQLEYNSSLMDNRLKPKALRLTKSELTNGSLDIYRDWFINNPLKLNGRKVLRLMQKEDARNKLGWISDIDLANFEKEISFKSECEKDIFKNSNVLPEIKEAADFLENTSNSEQWKKQLFPLDYVQLVHSPSNIEIKNKIEKEWNKLKLRAEKILL